MNGSSLLARILRKITGGNKQGTKTLYIGNVPVGRKYPAYIIAEIGINHNGDIEIAKKLINAAAEAGCQAVKFQKRTVDIVYTESELSKSREVNSDILKNAVARGVLPPRVR